VLPEFLPFFMQSDLFMERAQAISVGSLSPTINWKTLAKEEFVLPPLEEQKLLAKRLTSADKLREALSETIVATKNLLRAKVADISNQSSCSLKLDEVMIRITSGARGWAEFYSDQGSVFFRISNMQRGRITPSWADTKWVNPPRNEEALRTKLVTNDILISVTAELGLVTLVTDDFPDAYVNQHVALLRPNTEKINPAFVAFFLSSPSGMRQFQRFNDYGAKAGMNLKNITKLELPAIPLVEQTALAKQFSTLDASWATLQERSTRFKSMRKHLLELSLLGQA